MQNDYVEKNETSAIKVVFNDVKAYDIPQNMKWSKISILDTKIDKNKIIFSLINDITDDYEGIKFYRCRNSLGNNKD